MIFKNLFSCISGSRRMIQAMQPLNGLAIGDFVFAAVLVNVMPAMNEGGAQRASISCHKVLLHGRRGQGVLQRNLENGGRWAMTRVAQRIQPGRHALNQPARRFPAQS
mgnify:CR=1 FL=1